MVRLSLSGTVPTWIRHESSTIIAIIIIIVIIYIIIIIIIIIVTALDTYQCRHHRKLKETISTLLLPLFHSLGIRRKEIKHFFMMTPTSTCSTCSKYYFQTPQRRSCMNKIKSWIVERLYMVCFVLIQKNYILNKKYWAETLTK